MLNPRLASTAVFLAALTVQAAAHPFQKSRAQAPSTASGGKVLAADAVPQEEGVPGTEFPLVQSVLRPDAPMHEDTTGNAAREVLDLAGAPGGGFALVWQDGRDGNMGLYFARLGLDGKPRERERPPYDKARSSRELDPAIALNGAGAGAISWREKSMPNGYYFTSLFGPDGRFAAVQLPMGFEFPESGGRGRDAKLVEPSVAVLADGSGVCAWLAGNRAMLQVVRAAGPLVQQPAELSRAEHPATSRPVIGGARDATLLVAWGTRGGIECIVRPPRGVDERNALGAGEPLDVASDLNGGWWVLVEHESRRVLRHVDAHGKVERDFALAGAGSIVDFGVASWGLLLAVDGERGRGDFALHCVPGGVEANVSAPIAFESETGKVGLGVCVAASGDVGLVAWRERRGPDFVIVARTVDAKGTLGPIVDVSSDRASANQSSPDLASNGTDRAVCAWIDRRNGDTQVWTRTLDAKGFVSREFALPAALPNSPAPSPASSGAAPAVAMSGDSRFAVAWFDVREGGATLELQAFGADAAALAPALAVDAGLQGLGDAVLLAVPDGYTLFWTRAGQGLAVRRFDFQGRPLGEAVLVSTDATAANVSACRLDVAPRERGTREFAVAWDVSVPGEGRRLRVRVLGERLELTGRELAFDTMYLGADWDPAIAPADDGGFVLIWTAGDARVRDVFARAYAGDGKPRSRPFAVSVRANEQDYPELTRLADGTYALAWEDDIAMFDFVNVRRLSEDLTQLGPTLQLCERPEEFLKAHNHAKVAAFREGFVAVWTDTRRSQGSDVYWKVVGARFDARGARGK